MASEAAYHQIDPQEFYNFYSYGILVILYPNLTTPLYKSQNPMTAIVAIIGPILNALSSPNIIIAIMADIANQPTIEYITAVIANQGMIIIIHHIAY